VSRDAETLGKPKNSPLINTDTTGQQKSAQEKHIPYHLMEMFTFFELLTVTC
jgi:hypothetical protein